MTRLSDMEAFVTAVKAGSFAAAAKEMRVSPQRVGRQVANLEERLGAQLLVRTTRKHSLSEIGQAYLERCREVIRVADAADKIVTEYGPVPKGELVISAPLTFGTLRLVPFLTGYLDQHKGVRIRLVLTDRNIDVVGDGFDAAVRIGPLEDSNLIARRLGTFQLAACAAPAYVARHGRPQTPDDLVHHNCLIYTYRFRPPLSGWRFERKGKAVTVSVTGNLWINDGRAVIEAAIAGHGIALQDEDILWHEVAAGRLIHLLPDYTGPSREVNLLYAANKHMPVKLRSFIDELTRYLGRRRPIPAA